MMNITIIIPAIQIMKKEPDSPQPTTPFPPISITPSPLCYSMTPCSQYDYEHTTKYSRSEFSANIFSESIDFSKSPYDDRMEMDMDNSLEYNFTQTSTPVPPQVDNSKNVTPEPTEPEQEPEPEQTQTESVEETEKKVETHDAEILKADSTDQTTTAASTPDTVIPLTKSESQEFHSEIEESVELTQIAPSNTTMMMQVPNINFVQATPRVSPEPESDEGGIVETEAGEIKEDDIKSEDLPVESETAVNEEKTSEITEGEAGESLKEETEVETLIETTEEKTEETAAEEKVEEEVIEEASETKVEGRFEEKMEEKVIEEKVEEKVEEKSEEIIIPIHTMNNKSKVEKKAGETKAEKSIKEEKCDTGLQNRKMKPFPDPRKPSNYPQRLNKVTLARQALAREKRRVYVEERIQSYIRSSQTTGQSTILPSTNIQMSQSSHSHSHSHQYTKSEKQTRVVADPLPIVKPVVNSQTESTLNEMEMEDMNSSNNSLPDIEQNYFLNNSIYLPPNPKPFSAMSVARVPTRKSSSLTSLHKINKIGSTGSIPQISCSTGSQKNIYVNSIPEETSEWWKGVSEQQGFFYSFRVRQSGPVQMHDKSVQTLLGESHSEGFTVNLPHHSPNGSIMMSRKMQQSYSSSFTHLPIAIDDRDKILREITETVQLRHDAELRRAELVQRANDLQSRVKEKRDKITRRHEFWHKKYIEESSLTRPLEASCNSLRAELNTVHRRLLAHLEGRDLPLRLRDGPSKKANYKIMAARLQHEIKELQQKVKAAKLRLESEIKLKEQADREVRDVRNDLSHKKVVMSLARSQVGGLPPVHPRSYEPLVY